MAKQADEAPESGVRLRDDAAAPALEIVWSFAEPHLGTRTVVVDESHGPLVLGRGVDRTGVRFCAQRPRSLAPTPIQGFQLSRKQTIAAEMFGTVKNYPKPEE
jgi:hypothetical protein